MNSLLNSVFFLSGTAALLFETLWFHQASLAFGNSVWASSLVLAGFMGGLGLGNALAARHAHRFRRPVLAYSVLEAVVGVAGVVIVVLLPALGPLLAPVVRPLLEAPSGLGALRFAASLAVLLVPSTAMGATLPILVKAAVAQDSNFGRVLGRLYGWNTAGAVVGALAGEVLLIGWLGIRGSAVAAGLLSGIAAASAAVLARRSGPAQPAELLEAGPAPLFAWLSPRAWRLLAAAFLAGASLLALEVVWFRFLLLFVHGSNLAFALMLATVLAGIACGGLAASVWLGGRRNAAGHAARVALLTGILCVAGYASLRLLVDSADDGYVSSWTRTLPRALLLIFPVSLCSGALFPLLGSELRGRLAGDSLATGLVTLANTAGAMLGSLVAGFALLPGLGVEASIFALAASYGAVAWLASGEAAASRPIARYLPAAAFALCLLLFPFGLMERHYLRIPIERYEQPGATKVLAVREALTETIILLEYEAYGAPQEHRLITNGFSMSGTSPFAKRYMKLYVYWPVALRPDPKSALLISYGVGSTARALADTRSLETIDVVDISEDILELSNLVYPDPEQNPLRDPRVRVHVEDGRYFLQTTERRFDLITSEPPPPKKAGIVSLYTREYFQLVHDRLNEAGVATYWLPAQSLLASDSQAIIRAFCDAFPDCSLWNAMRLNWMLVGTRGLRGPVDEQAFSAQWRDPVVAPELRAVGLETPEQLGALFIAGAPALRRLTQPVAPLVDDYPQRLSRLPPDVRSNAIHRSWTDTQITGKRFAESRYIDDLWPEALRQRTLAAFDAQRILNGQLFLAREARASTAEDLFRLLTETRLETLPLWLLGSNALEQRSLERLWRSDGSTPALDLPRALGAIAARDYDLAEELIARASLSSSRPVDWERSLVRCLKAGDPSLCPSGAPRPRARPEPTNASA